MCSDGTDWHSLLSGNSIASVLELVPGSLDEYHQITVSVCPRIAPGDKTMPKHSSLVLATDREVQHAKPRGARAEFRIKGARNLVLRVSATAALAVSVGLLLLTAAGAAQSARHPAPWRKPAP